MATDRPPSEPVPPRALHVPPFRGRAFDALMCELDVSAEAKRVLSRPGCEVGPGRLASLLSITSERPERALRRMARQLEGGGR